MAGEGVFGSLLGQFSSGFEGEQDKQKKEKRQAMLDAQGAESSAMQRALQTFQLQNETELAPLRRQMLTGQIADVESQRKLREAQAGKSQALIVPEGASIYEQGQAPVTPNPRPAPVRNIDPLSPEGLAAAGKRPMTPFERARLALEQQGLSIREQGQNRPKAVPPSIQTKLATNKTIANQIDGLIAMAGTPAGATATGWKGYVPDAILQRADQGGNAFRALLSDIGSRTIHERTGAAMGVKEWARLRGFVPTETDSHAQVVNKLTRMRQALADETTAMGMPYGISSLDEVGGPSNIPEARGGAPPSAKKKALPNQIP